MFCGSGQVCLIFLEIMLGFAALQLYISSRITQLHNKLKKKKKSLDMKY